MFDFIVKNYYYYPAIETGSRIEYDKGKHSLKSNRLQQPISRDRSHPTIHRLHGCKLISSTNNKELRSTSIGWKKSDATES